MIAVPKKCEFCLAAPATVYGGFKGADDWAGYACDSCAAASSGFQSWDRIPQGVAGANLDTVKS